MPGELFALRTAKQRCVCKQSSTASQRVVLQLKACIYMAEPMHDPGILVQLQLHLCNPCEGQLSGMLPAHVA